MRQSEIKRISERNRKQLVRYQAERRRDMYVLLDNTASVIERVIMQVSDEGKVDPASVGFIHTGITAAMVGLRPRMRSLIVSSMKHSADLGIMQGIYSSVNHKGHQVGTSYFDVQGRIRRSDPAREKFIDSKWAKLQSKIVGEQLVFHKTGTTLTESIYDTARQAERNLKAQIGSAAVMDAPVKEVTSIVSNALTRPAKEVRQAIERGSKVISQAAADAPVTPGYSASAFTNFSALLTIKTQSAYNGGVKGYAGSKPMVKGYISRVHTGNPEPYDASINGLYFPKGQEPDPPYHFGCQCTLELVYDEPAQSQWGDEEQRRGYDYWMSKNVA